MGRVPSTAKVARDFYIAEEGEHQILMRTEVVTEEGRLQELVLPWRELHREAHGTIFQTPEWLVSWWKIYGDLFGLRVLAAWDGSQLVGLFPCFLGRTSFFTYARFLGEYAIFGEYSPLVHPSVMNEMAASTAEFASRLVTRDRCTFLDFHHVPAVAPAMQSLIREIGTRQLQAVYTQRSLPRIVVHVPGTWDSYVQSLPSHERHLVRLMVRTEQRANPPFRVALRRDLAALDDLIRLHGIVWAGRAKSGFFIGRHRFEQFFRSALPPLLDAGLAAFYTIHDGSTTIASTLAFFTETDSCAYISGRNPDHALRKFSPGKMLLNAIIRDSIRLRVKRCDLMEGLTGYKFRVGGEMAWFSRYTIFPTGVLGLPGRAFVALVALRKLASRFKSRTDSQDAHGNHHVG